MPPVLSTRTLNRALLARQWLLERRDTPIDQAIEHLIGLQAQTPRSPYYGLAARLEGFQPEVMSAQLERREAVRGSLFRGTLHWVTTRDWLQLRPLLQPVGERLFRAQRRFAQAVDGIDVAELRRVAREFLEERPRSGSELGRLLAPYWPGRDARALAYAVQYLEPVVQTTPRGLWNQSGQAVLASSEAWLGRPLGPSQSMERVVLRYLAAFGPASPADMRTWSGFSGVAEVMERLRPNLLTFQDENGRELFDLPDAPRPEANTPAPPRFLPDYDNVFLSHADRTRIVSEEHRRHWAAGAGIDSNTFLVDGFGAGLWRIERPADADVAILVLGAIVPLSADDRVALEVEGLALLRFAAPDALSHRVEFAAQPRSAPRGRTGVVRPSG